MNFKSGARNFRGAERVVAFGRESSSKPDSLVHCPARICGLFFCGLGAGAPRPALSRHRSRPDSAASRGNEHSSARVVSSALREAAILVRSTRSVASETEPYRMALLPAADIVAEAPLRSTAR